MPWGQGEQRRIVGGGKEGKEGEGYECCKMQLFQT